MQHSRSKHTKIIYHFLRDHAQKGVITLEFMGTKYQLVDILIKPLNEDKFVKIRLELGLISIRLDLCH